MNCQNCLTTLPQGATFCARCGSSQTTNLRVADQITQLPFLPSSASPDETVRVQPQNAPFSPTGKMPTPVYLERATSVLLAERKEQKEREEQEHAEREKEEANERLLVFSDAIIAFALTVAAITIKIPTSVEQLQLQANQLSIFIRSFMYIIAFAIVADAWADHHAIFHHIKRNDIVLIALNFIYLIAIVLFPIGLFFLEFGVELGSVDAKIGASQAELGVGIFLGSQIIAGLALFWMWKYANKRSRLVNTQIEPRFISYMARRLLSKPLLYILAIMFIGVGVFFPPILLIFLVIFIAILIARPIYFRSYGRGLDLTVGANDTGRIQLFSDAVIGIAITLAVAQIEFPSLAENSKGALEAIDHQWPLLHAFLVGIVIMGVYWFFHYQLFRLIERHDDRLVWLNCVFLLGITLMLVPINWLVNYYDKPEMGAYYFFGFWQILTSLVLAIMWRHSRKKRLLAPETSDEQIKHFGTMIIANPIIFLVLTIIAAFVPTMVPSAYIGLYLALIGAIWLFSHKSTRRQIVSQNTDTSKIQS